MFKYGHTAVVKERTGSSPTMGTINSVSVDGRGMCGKLEIQQIVTDMCVSARAARWKL